ncbi:MAG: HpcH/HpaI aldolase/citrate lyase family protein [Arthrobacter sp.]|uniref:HpcH/HpaI aldolase/citrate lyase family protein n=1 Tax=unclassified Arthrobacter TaxID=235627 RepID=UPI00264C4910|nr:CoA ester lyase [Micrococcaceae bacterium]MDN5813423.1 CoA ester lyase [Micrococcaceae bacterium]MDN5824216.1 CoA ester lyase [Micrococcaceae bacterium]MDN5878461.1 CoA ester lyase [Micrococcaceae bacterium]MDN5887246.1 CoA ester lyase [Micrococcaceae bacterium]
MSDTSAPAFTMGPAILFCPADRPERYAKASARADAVIIDLEDAVAPTDKPAARRSVVDTPLDPGRTIVRVNPVDTEDFAEDLAAVGETAYSTVMLAKTETVEQLRQLADYRVIALCETALGVLNAPAIAAEPNVVALMWGAEDLVASLGGTSSRHDDGSYRDVAVHARAAVLLAAGAYGKAGIDSVYINIPDTEGLAAETRDAVASGFAAKASIHPAQMTVIRAAYAPDPEAVQRARAILEAARTASGVFSFEGQMVDEPLLRHARRLVARIDG